MGKSTLHKSLMSHSQNYVNPDEIIKENGGDWRNKVDFLIAIKIALHNVQTFIENGESFELETTNLHYLLKHVTEAKKRDFSVHMNFIVVNDLSILKNRIEKRVAEGGHGVPFDLLEYRFANQFGHLKELLQMCDKVNLFDNKETMKLVGVFQNSKPTFIDENMDWLRDFYHKSFLVQQKKQPLDESAAEK